MKTLSNANIFMELLFKLICIGILGQQGNNEYRVLCIKQIYLDYLFLLGSSFKNESKQKSVKIFLVGLVLSTMEFFFCWKWIVEHLTFDLIRD